MLRHRNEELEGRTSEFTTSPVPSTQHNGASPVHGQPPPQDLDLPTGTSPGGKMTGGSIFYRNIPWTINPRPGPHCSLWRYTPGTGGFSPAPDWSWRRFDNPTSSGAAGAPELRFQRVQEDLLIQVMLLQLICHIQLPPGGGNKMGWGGFHFH